MPLLELTATYLLVAVPYTANSKCKHFEIEGVPPDLAIGATTMCKQLLRVKHGEKADFMFILGHPSLRPALTAEHKAAFIALFEEAGYDQVYVKHFSHCVFVSSCAGTIFPQENAAASAHVIGISFPPANVAATWLRERSACPGTRCQNAVFDRSRGQD